MDEHPLVYGVLRYYTSSRTLPTMLKHNYDKTIMARGAGITYHRIDSNVC